MLTVGDQTYEWDPEKRALNLQQHGLDFESIAGFSWDTSKIEPSPRKGEERFLAIGFIGKEVYSVVYTLRQDRTRLISMRRANRTEVKKHEEYLRATGLSD